MDLIAARDGVNSSVTMPQPLSDGKEESSLLILDRTIAPPTRCLAPPTRCLAPTQCSNTVFSNTVFAELQNIDLEFEFLRFQYRAVKDIGCLIMNQPQKFRTEHRQF